MLRVPAALLLVLVFSSCGTPQKACLRPEIFCVGLVTSTAGLDDHALNASAWEGVQRAVQEGTVQQADSIESVDARDYGKNIDFFASQGYDLIVSAGPGLRDATAFAAAEHPKLHFLGLDQQVSGEPTPNLILVSFPKERGGFLAGALAALVSQTGIVGAVCETSGIDSMWQYCEGFRLGALHEKEDLKVLVTYHENASPDSLFTDEGWGARTAGNMLNRGADVIFGVGGRLGQGALRRAAQEHAWSIGSEQDQFYRTREARASLLSSAVPQAQEAVYEFIRRLAAGNQVADMQGDMILAPYHEGERFVPLSAQAGLLALEASLEDGSLTIHPVKPR